MRFTKALLNSTDKTLWQLALPMIFSNLAIPLLGIVDTAVIGHLESPDYLGGVAVGAMISSFVFMLLIFLRMSTTGLTAQAHGEKNSVRLLQMLVQPLILALCGGVTIILLRDVMTSWALNFVGGEINVIEQARHFLSVRWWGAPATLSNLALLGWLLGMRYARASIIMLVVGNLINIVLSLFFVTVLHYGVKGVALASVLSEYTTLGLAFVLVRQVLRRERIKFNLSTGAWRGNFLGLLRLNRDVMLRSFILQSCFALLTVLGARLGNEIVAVNAILMNFLLMTAYALDGFALAVEVYSGNAYGEKNKQKLLNVWYSACKQAGFVALLFSLCYGLMGKEIISLMTSLPALIELANDYLIWQIVLPLVGVWCYLLDGLFIGAARGREMRNSMLYSALGFIVAVSALPWLGNHGLWLALSLFLGLRGVTLGWIWYQHWKKESWFVS